MYYLYLLVLMGSIIALLFMFIYAFRHPKTLLNKAFMAQIILIMVWTLASILEISSTNETSAFLWRNIQQIAVFYMPLTILMFTVEYTQHLILRKSYNLLAFIQTIGIILIFTDSYHHIMRIGHRFAEHPLFGKQIVVNLTLFGEIWITLNYLIVFFALCIMIEFIFHVPRPLKKQVIGVAFSIILSTVFAWIKTAFLESKGIYIPISVMFLPSCIILFYILYKHNFFHLSPIARNKVFNVIQEGILVIETNGRIVDYNPYFVEIMKKYFKSDEDIIGNFFQELLNDKIDMDLATITSQTDWEIEVGKHQFLSIKSYPLGLQSEDLGFVLIITEITEAKLRELDLLIKAQQDPMTTLLNRYGFLHSIDKMLGDARWGKLFSLLILDLDYFKRINDEYGHVAGDQVIIHFSKQLQQLLEPDAIISRIGGEEFAVVLPLIDKYRAFEAGERIREHIENTPVECSENRKISYTVSVGISDSNEANNLNQLTEQADQALYQVKRTSRNRVDLYHH